MAEAKGGLVGAMPGFVDGDRHCGFPRNDSVAMTDQGIDRREEPVTDRIRAALAWAALLFSVAGFGAALYFDGPPYVGARDITWAASFLAFPVVGLMLALKVPTNSVGWLFTIGPGFVLWGVALSEAGRDEAGDSVFAVGLMVIFAAILLFPDGRYPNRWIMYAHVALALGILIEPRISTTTDGSLTLAGSLALAMFVLIFRTVTGGSLLRRQIGLPAFVVLTGAAGAVIFPLTPFGKDLLADLSVIYLLIGIPIAIGASVVRYKLYDLDRLVSRTVTYVAVVAALGSVYTGLVVGLRTLLPIEGDLPVAISTLIVASAFLPAARRVQRIVDRRFFRSRYDAGMVVARVADDLRGQLDLAQAVTGVETVIAEVLSPVSVSVWVSPES